MNKLPRILLINDDGVEAEGLRVAEEIAAPFAEELWVVAPQGDQSGASHALTTRHPVRVAELGPRRYGVVGTPSDCVVLAVKLLMKDRTPDLVISGVNQGANLADDIAYSGTVSGALTANLCDIPAVALSQAYRSEGAVSWDTARMFGSRVLEHVLADGVPRGLCLNVNFPAVAPAAVTGIRATRQGSRSIRSIAVDSRMDLRSRAYYWLTVDCASGVQAPDTDIAALRAKAVSVTPLRPDRTDDAALARLADVLG
jgi:5'-nucleotidase